MRFATVAIMLLLSFHTAVGSWRDNIALRGYLRETLLLWEESAASDRYNFTNLLHTRQNLRWYRGTSFIAGLEVKTRLFNGDRASQISSTGDISSVRDTWFELSHRFVERDRTLLISTIDRAWVDFTYDSWQLTVGRQRIAWGTNLVWNPIDLFNPSSPFDFDNEEMPGSDAVRLQRYLGPAELFEVAVAPQREPDASTAAVQLKVNRWEYDLILLGGRRGSDAVTGVAWTGNILKGGFRGELLYSIPRSLDQEAQLQSFNDSPYIIAAVSGDYTWPNTIYLHGGVLYNERGTTKAAGDRAYEAWQSGELTPARLSAYLQFGGNLSPLMRADLMCILNPYDHSYYVGPSFIHSPITNLDFTLIGLIFDGNPATEFGEYGNILLSRLKYSF